MINKKEFDLLLKEISQIENKIVEIKVLNQFDKANEYENRLAEIREVAKTIHLDQENLSRGFDDISLSVLHSLISLKSELDYFVLKTNNIIESIDENRIDAEALEKIKNLWENLDKYVSYWESCPEPHNPIEEMDYNKQIGNLTLEIIIYQLQIEGVLNYHKVFKYCKKEYLINSIKETLFNGAKEEFQDEIRRRNLTNVAKNLTEKDLYDYRIWQQVLLIKNVRSRDDHIEIMGSAYDVDPRKLGLKEHTYDKEKTNVNAVVEKYEDYSIFRSIREWFSQLNETANQRKMDFTWATNKGPAFKIEYIDGTVRYAKQKLTEQDTINARKLFLASNGVAKYNFDKNSALVNLEELEIYEEKNTAGINISPDRTYNCIGNNTFAGCKKLKEINFGKIEVIGNEAFRDCDSLTNLEFSKSIKNIGEDAFLDCKNLVKVEFLGDLQVYMVERPQNILNCFKGTKLKQIIYPTLDTAFNFAIADCPKLENIYISNLQNISIPFNVCKYRLGRNEGIVAFTGEKALSLWKTHVNPIKYSKDSSLKRNYTLLRKDLRYFKDYKQGYWKNK